MQPEIRCYFREALEREALGRLLRGLDGVAVSDDEYFDFALHGPDAYAHVAVASAEEAALEAGSNRFGLHARRLLGGAIAGGAIVVYGKNAASARLAFAAVDALAGERRLVVLDDYERLRTPERLRRHYQPDDAFCLSRPFRALRRLVKRPSFWDWAFVAACDDAEVVAALRAVGAEASASGEFVTASGAECVFVRAGGEALREALATESDQIDLALDGATPRSFWFAETSEPAPHRCAERLALALAERIRPLAVFDGPRPVEIARLRERAAC